MRKQTYLGKGRKAFSALDTARGVWQSLDTPISLSCYLLAKYGEWGQLVRKSVNPRDYTTDLDFYKDYQSVQLLAKYPNLKTGISTKKEAMKAFLEAEQVCALTNERIRGWKLGIGSFSPNDRVSKVLFLAQRKIASILGPVPSYENMNFKFGPGASFGCRGHTSVYNKMGSPFECTQRFTQIAGEFLSEFPAWTEASVHNTDDFTVEVNCVEGSELAFVPKNAKTDRPICIEPLLNGLYQKGVGSWIRERLKRVGINLNDQSINQRLAQKAWLSGLSTVDFSSASDTIAYMLVLELLPIDWFEFLEVARCEKYLCEGNWYPFHKFSSMGNAYTFELESLIFFALAAACCDVEGIVYEVSENLSVYGDDVIIPQAAFSLFQEVNQFCGFKVNSQKTYVDGVFFESCGKDWFKGSDVRPQQLKVSIETLEQQYYVTNLIYLIAERINALGANHHGGNADRIVCNLLSLHADSIAAIPRRLRYPVPMESGRETGLWSDFDIARPTRHECWDGWIYSARAARSHRIVAPDRLDVACYFAGSSTPKGWWDVVSEESHSGGYSIRTKTPQYRTAKQFVLGEWPSLPLKWSERAAALIG